MSWPQVSIKEFCQTASGGTPSRKVAEYYGGSIPWIKSGDLRENIVTKASEYITELAIKNSSANLVPKDSILLAMYGATVGRMAMLGIEAATNQAVCSIIPNPNRAYTRYVYYALLSKVPFFLRSAVGGAQPNISQGLIKDTKIPLPSLEEQKRIAAILDKADALRRKRQQAIDLADQFLRSVFLEMFGDPVTNPKGWPMGSIRDLVSEAKYGTAAKADTEKGKFPILRMGNLTYQGQLDLSDLKYVDLDEKDEPKYLVREGDLLFNRTNSRELVGKTAVYDLSEPMAAAGYLVRVRTNEAGNPYYISGYLNSAHGKATLAGMCKSIVGMANINAQEMQDIEIMLPPVSLQKRFEQISKDVKRKLKKHSQSLAEFEKLFSALSQQAFMGHL